MRSFDLLSTLRLPELSDKSPIIVAIDEPSLAEIGRQWPWPRDYHARLVKNLRAAGARAIALDIVFAEPSDRAADAELASALGPDVVLAADETEITTPQAQQRIRVEPLSEFVETGAVVGLSTISLDGDGVLRRLPEYGDSFARQIMSVAGYRTATGSARLLRVFGPARTYPTVSYYQALDPATFLPPETFRDRVVIVGLSLQTAPSTETGGADAYATPMTLWSSRLTSGAEIQATMLDNLSGDLLVTAAPAWVSMIAMLAATLLASAAVIANTNWRTLLVGSITLGVMLVVAFALVQWGGYFIAPVGPVLAFTVVAAAQGGRDYAAERRLRKLITRAFSQYLSPVMVERLAADPSRLRLGGELRTLTVLFTDVRGFTTIAESMKENPEKLTLLVNRLLNPLSAIVLDADGTIDKYMGDCLMAFWNAPLDEPRHAEKAVGAALRMLEALDSLNRELAMEDKTKMPLQLGIGIGINTGSCVVGNMGSDLRFDYTAIGDAVNLASRLEGATRDLGVPILLGPETAALVSPHYAIHPVAEVAVKGRAQRVPVFGVAARR